jgi:DNA repair exonuclease SbcCD ATPase subunit
MIDLKFSYLRAKNTLCFGEEGVEFHLDRYGPIIAVKGVNKDTGTKDSPASNGSGKSSIQDILSYGIYGKTVKKPKQMSHDKVVNAKADGKGLEVEVVFGDYRILRQRGPNKLRLWCSKDHVWDDKTEITRGTMKDTQDTIEGVVGMTHQAFCNVVVFDDSSTYAFLESDTPTKRTIVENLLGLDQYRDFHDVAKEMQKDVKLDVKSLTSDYERCQIELEQCSSRITKIELQEDTWKKTKIAEASKLMATIKSKQEALQSLDSNGEMEKYQTAQDRVVILQAEIDEANAKKIEITEALRIAKDKVVALYAQKDEVNERIQIHNNIVRQADSDIEKSSKLVGNLNNLAVGAKCPVCHATIDVSNYQSVLDHEQHVIESKNNDSSKAKLAISNELSKFKEHQVNIVKLEEIIKNAEAKLSSFGNKCVSNIKEMNEIAKLQKPNMDAKQQVLESEITELKLQMKSKREELEGGSPYKEILSAAIEEKKEKAKENELSITKLKVAEDKLPYYDFWVKAFGDKGIRKFVVDGIIPALNSRIAYWMEHLYEGQIELSFDNELIETITRNGVSGYYPALSNGEKQRVNLAVSQSFAYVMMLNSGSCPSLAFLDEITGGGIDKSGVSGVFNMICELSKERQVFITTHNEYLLNMLDGYEEIVLEKENDITRLVS